MPTTPSDNSAGSQGVAPGLDSFFRQDTTTPQAATSGGLSSFFQQEEQAKPKPIKASPSGQIDTSTVDSIAQREGLSATQRQVMGALLGQESNNGANAATSINGARGAGQVMPGTFKQYAKPGEDIGNADHNLAVMARIVKDLGSKSGDDPAKIAVGYFSGPGNINTGAGQAWRNDVKDGNGKSTSSYATDVLARLTGSGNASAVSTVKPLASDSAPAWTSVIAKPEYQALSDADKAAARDEYFQTFIQPDVSPGQRGKYRDWFNKEAAKAEDAAKPSLLKSIKSAAAGAIDAVGKMMGPVPESVMSNLPRAERYAGDQYDASKVGMALAQKNRTAKDTELTALNSKAFPSEARDMGAPQANIKDIGSDAWAAAKGMPNAFSAAFQALKEGDSPANIDWKNKAIAESAQRQKNNAAATGAQDEYVLGITREKVRNLPQNLAFSVLSMGAGLAAGIPATLAGTAVAPGVGTIAGFGAGASASGLAAYRMDTNGFLRDIRQSLDQGAQKSIGRPLTDDEFTRVAVKYNDLVRDHGLWEALPEALGNVIGFGAGKMIFSAAGAGVKNALLKTAKGVGMELGGEMATETTTQIGQHNTELAAGTGQGSERSFLSMDDIAQSAKEVLPDVLLLTGVMGGGAHAAGKVNDKFINTPERQIAREINRSADGVQFTGIDEAARAALDPNHGAIYPRQTVRPPMPAQTQTAAIQEEQSAPTPHIDSQAEAVAAQTQTPAAATGSSAMPAQDILDYADSRYLQLRHARDGASTQSIDENGNTVDTEQPGAGLTAADHDELSFLEKNRGNADAIGAMYGFNVPLAAPAKHTDVIDKHTKAIADYKTAALSGDEVAAQAAEEHLAQARQDMNAAHVDAAKQLEERLIAATEQVAEKAAAPSNVKPKTEKEARAKRDTAKQDAIPAAELTPEQQALTYKAVKDGIIKPSTLRGERFRSGIIDATNGLALQSKDTGYLEGHSWARKVTDKISESAHQAATSPENDLAEPTQAQKEAGNYQKGHVSLHGLDISIENPVGSIRSGTDASGKAWSNTMQHHYGYIKGTIGADKDHIDTFIGENHDSDKVFVIDQVNPNTSKFDEHKIMLGFDSLDAAKAAYQSNYAKGWAGGKNVTETNVADFKSWLTKGETKSPFAAPKTEKQAATFNSKLIPDMSDAELVRAKAFYAPDHKRTPKIAKEIARRAKLDNAKLAPVDVAPAQTQNTDNAAQKGAAEDAIYNSEVDLVRTRWMAVNMTANELAEIAATEVEKIATSRLAKTVVLDNTEDAQTPEQDNGNPQSSDRSTRSEPVAAVAKEQAAPASNERTPVDLAGRIAKQVQATGDGQSNPAEADKPTATAGEGERIAQRSDAATRNADREIANGGSTPEAVAAKPRNFTITDELNFAGQGAKTKYKNNVAAIQLLKTLDAEKRQATSAEQSVLATYIGWGGLPQAFNPKDEKWSKEFTELKELLTPEEYATAASSTRNAHYTAAPVVSAIWSAVQRMGFTNGAVLEPSAGSGNFFGLMPAELRKSKLLGVEFDHITGGIAKQLYPLAKINAPIGFQDIKLAPESFDLAIGNPPFGSEQLYDKAYPELSKFKIHGFFFAKSVASLRPGGVLAMVVSKGLLDAGDAQGRAARDWLAKETRLLGAIRLPNSAFQENANTEVTTDIVFLQKLGVGVSANASEWIGMGELKDTATGEPISINQYFVAHPEMMLGEMTLAGSMYRANEPTLAARPGDNLTELLAKAVESLPSDILKIGARNFIEATEKINAKEAKQEVADVREYGHYLQDGKLYQRMPDANGERQAVEVARVGRELERITGMVELRDLVRRQLALEKDASASPVLVASNREKMNAAYDAFQVKNGYLNSQTNKRLFQDDSDAALVLSLEAKYDKGISQAVGKASGQKSREAKAGKATIFSRRVQTPMAVVGKVETAKEAMMASLNERGRIDPAYMTGIYGKDMDAIASELGDLAYESPADGWQPRDLYLSGNVKAALQAAREAATTDARFERNVSALMAVQPADINPSDIFVKIGSPWVAASDYHDFAQAMFGGKVTGSFASSIGRWTVSVEGGTATETNSKYGTDRMPANKIIEALMTNKQVAIYDSISDGNGGTKPILNIDATAAAQGKADELAEQFGEWIWHDNDRRERLTRSYNDVFNTNVKRIYSGAHLSLPGMNPTITLRPHQLNWVYRSLIDGIGLADHVVGAGKTFGLIATAMEMRRLGLAKKPIITVPNHLVGQWAKDILTLYPGANVLAASRKDFGKDRRKLLFSKIATGDWDMVVVAHSSFGRIPVPPETERAILDGQFNEIIDALQAAKADKGARFTVKDLERAKTKIEEKLKKLADRKQDDMLDFADLGADALFVDEAHEFKNLFFTTALQGVAGLGSPTGSSRAFDMFVKTRHVLQRTGNRNIFFATGTPLANSIAEVFHMQRFLQYDTLKARNIHQFDAWANTFGQATSDWEMNAAGKFVQKTRFRKFANLPELKGIWNEVSDTVTRPDLISDAEKQGLRFPLPKIATGKAQNVVTERSPQQADFIGIPQPKLDADGKQLHDETTGQPIVEFKEGTIVYRLDNWKQASKTNSKEIPLAITGAARKAGLDFRLIDDNAPDFEGSKINAAVSRIFDIWKANDHRSGTQLVFCDLSVPAKHKGQATTEAAAKTPTFFVKSGEAINHVAGVALTLPAAPDSQFFSYKDGKQYKIYERTSGLNVAVGSTKQEAIDAANSRLTKIDKVQFQKNIDERDISSEQIDDYLARWEEAQSASDAEDVDASTKEISLDEMLADSGSSFSVYDDIKTKLIAKGMPADQIAFIHDYDTDDKKAALFNAMNSGAMRVLLGSTQKMGAGTNVQAKMVALHHMDAPWRPADLEQREGRIIRQGNEFYEADPDGFEVNIFRYATKQTYDSRMWEIIETKARAIEQFKADASLREIEDVSSESANAAEMKAGASGNPLILTEIGMRADLRKLDAQKKSWDKSRFDLQKKVKSAEDKTGWVYGRERFYEKALKQVEPKDGAVLELNGKKVADVKKLEPGPTFAILMSGAAENGGRGAFVAEYRGFNVQASMEASKHGIGLAITFKDEIIGHTSYRFDDKFSVAGLMTRLDNMVDGVGKELESARQSVVAFEKDAESAGEELKRGFPKAAELDRLRAEHKEVVSALRSGKTEVGETIDSKPVFSMAEKSVPEKQWLSAGILEDIVGKHMTQFFTPIPIRIVDRTVDVAGESAEMDGGMIAGGVTKGGVVYLIREGLPTTGEAINTLFHELLHFGLRRFLTKDQYISTMRQLYQTDGWVRKYVDHWVAGIEGKELIAKGGAPEYVRARGVDEALAHLSETINTTETGYNNTSIKAKTIRTVSRWMARLAEKFGFHEAAVRYRAVANDEARALVKSIFAKLKSGESPETTSTTWQHSDPAFSRQKVTDYTTKELIAHFGEPKQRNVSLWNKTVGTMLDLAEKQPTFKKVFDIALNRENAVSITSLRPAELAPGVLPRNDSFLGNAKTLALGRTKHKQMMHASQAVIEGTLSGESVLQGKVWTDEELRSEFNADDLGIALYKQSRAAIDASLDEVAAAEAFGVLQAEIPKATRAQVLDDPGQAEAIFTDAIDKKIRMQKMRISNLESKFAGDDVIAKANLDLTNASEAREMMLKIFNQADMLKKAGYAPLQRFGQHAVWAEEIDPETGKLVIDKETGETNQLHFERFETTAEAKAEYYKLSIRYKDDPSVSVKTGPVNGQKHQLYSGMSPETFALFADVIGKQNALTSMYQHLVSERSALKRRLERKNIAGFSRDLPRILATFITSNGRYASQQYYNREFLSAIKYIPRDKGDIQEAALGLKKYLDNPDNGGAIGSSLAFTMYIAGNIGSVVTNATQPMMMSFPALSQYTSTINAAAQLALAYPKAMGKKELADPELRAAMRRASLEGKVDAQEIFHLYSVGIQGLIGGATNIASKVPVVGKFIQTGGDDLRARGDALLTLLGMPFAAIEAINRRATFIAAWNIAKQNKDESPYAFAASIVDQTQGIYNKVNRPTWARSSVGRNLMIFTQFKIMAVELIGRMWRQGGAQGKKAAAVSVAMLILASGASGFPFADDLDDLIDTIGQFMGFDTNMKRKKREWAYNTLGKFWGGMALYGVTAHMPFDMSGRLSLGNMLPATGIGKISNDGNNIWREIQEIAGPAWGGVATSFGKGFQEAALGNYGSALFNAFAPTFVKNAAAGADMIATGKAKTAGGGMKANVTTGEGALKMIGLNPTTVAEKNRTNMPIQQDLALYGVVKADIAKMWAMGEASNDKYMSDRAQEKMIDWNKKNPEMPINISSAQIRSKVKSLLTPADDRLMKGAPKGMRGMVAAGLDMGD